MRLVMELDHTNDGEFILIGQNEIEMLGTNPVEGFLPIGAIRTAFRLDDVGDPHLPENTIMIADRLLENSEKGALCRREQRLFSDVRQCG